MTNKKIATLMIKALRELKRAGHSPLSIVWKETTNEETATFGFEEENSFGYNIYGEIRLNNKEVIHIKQTNSLY